MDGLTTALADFADSPYCATPVQFAREPEMFRHWRSFSELSPEVERTIEVRNIDTGKEFTGTRYFVNASGIVYYWAKATGLPTKSNMLLDNKQWRYIDEEE